MKKRDDDFAAPESQSANPSIIPCLVTARVRPSINRDIICVICSPSKSKRVKVHRRPPPPPTVRATQTQRSIYARDRRRRLSVSVSFMWLRRRRNAGARHSPPPSLREMLNRNAWWILPIKVIVCFYIACPALPQILPLGSFRRVDSGVVTE